MKKKNIWLLSAVLTIALMFMLTACEPNVPDENGAEDKEKIDIDEGGRNDGVADDTEEGVIGNDNRNGDNRDNGVGRVVDDAKDGADRAVDDAEAELDKLKAVAGYTPTAHCLNGLFRLNLSIAANDAQNDFSHLPNEKIGWGIGKSVDEKNCPYDAIAANEEYGELGAVFLGERQPVIYLTFDEGYENSYTGEILDTLKAKNVKATFFVTYDYCKSVPELVQRMIDEGHVLGNHSYSHPSFPECSVEEMRSEIKQLHDYVKETFKYEMKIIRFPMGEFSQRSLAVAQSEGYTSMFWSFAYKDWNVNSQPDPSQSFEKIKSATHPGGIFLLHAVSKTNANILGDLVDYWHSEGYSLGTM